VRDNISSAMKIKTSDKALIQRYLLWCYKTTKENLDKIDRKFTQARVDRFILDHIEKVQFQSKPLSDYRQSIDDFKTYISSKEKDGRHQKYLGGKEGVLNSNYIYLQNRLNAIENAIRHFLGPRALAKINLLYEQEMTRRILESRDH
jgi:hypothetical protein